VAALDVEPTPEAREFAKRLSDGVMQDVLERGEALEKTSMAASQLSTELDPIESSEESSVPHRKSSQPAETPKGRDESGDPLAAYLPAVDEYDDEAFWYAPFYAEDTVTEAGSLLMTITLSVRRRLGEDHPLFWGILGRVYEPFAQGSPEELEERVTSAESDVLALRVRTGQADLLDYLDYFEVHRGSGDDFLESEYESFLEAVERASPAECEAVFSWLQQIEWVPGWRPPRPAEAYLPIADKF